MRKKVLFILLFMQFFCMHAYVVQEYLFDYLVVSDGRRFESGGGHVITVRDSNSFYRDVVQNVQPTVVKVVAGVENSNLQSIYHEVAEDFWGRVSFVSVSIADVVDIIRMIMVRLGIEQITLPLFLFFKQGTLILPIVTGYVTKESLTSHIEKRFFSLLVSDSFRSGPSLCLKETGRQSKEKKRELSTWKKLEDLGEKIRKWLFSLGDVSREIKAYQYSRKWKKQKKF